MELTSNPMPAFIRSLGVLMLLSAFNPKMPGQQPHPTVCGVVVDEHGAGVESALVVASGAGFNGWAESDAAGTFCLKSAGESISVRHAGFNPILKPISVLGTPLRLVLVKADASVKNMPNCQSLTNSGKGWIGGALRINPRGHYRGPVNGEHDAHWYVRRGKQFLHVVDGYAWHSGLPLQGLLSESKSLDVRGWESGKIVGLDLAGQYKDGRRWRWIAAPIAAAVSYEDATPEQADFFDRILETVYFSGR